MAKKNKGAKPPFKTIKEGGERQMDEPISPLGWKVIGAGVCCVALGFLALTRADALGRNWAATVSPLLILGGYALVGLGIFVPAASGGEDPPSFSPPAQP